MENLKLYVLFSTDGEPQEIPFAANDEADHFHIESSLKLAANIGTLRSSTELLVGSVSPFRTLREQHGFEGTVPLPLPKFLLIFALGEWPQDNHFRHMSAEIHFGKDLDPFHVGTLSKDNRSVCWQGTWREDLQVRGMLMSEEGLTGLLVITPVFQTSSIRSAERDFDMEALETSQTESQLTDALMEQGIMQENAPEAEDTRPDSHKTMTDKVTPSRIAVQRLKAEVTPEVAVQCSQPPALSNSNRKRRQSARDQSSTPGRQSRVKRLQLQQNSQTLGKATSPGGRTPRAADGSEPSARWGHAMCAISKKQAVLIGGQGENQVLSKDSVWLLDSDSMKWCVPAISHSDSSKPQYRMGHTAVYDPVVKCVYVYGGSKNLRWYNDVHVLDIESWRWSLVKASGKAPTRAYHTSTLFHDEMFVFGGVYPNPDPEPDSCSDQLHVFSPVTESWYEPVVMGKKPKARSGHSATRLGDQLVIFGGWDAPECFNDVHCLDLILMEFTSISVKGTPPVPRSWHASAALHGNRILIQGGFDGENAMTDAFVFRLDSQCWTTLLWPIPTTPTAGHTVITSSPRDSLSSDDAEDKENGQANRQQRLFIFGGGNNEGAFSNKLITFKLQLPSDS